MSEIRNVVGILPAVVRAELFVCLLDRSLNQFPPGSNRAYVLALLRDSRVRESAPNARRCQEQCNRNSSRDHFWTPFHRARLRPSGYARSGADFSSPLFHRVGNSLRVVVFERELQLVVVVVPSVGE